MVKRWIARAVAWGKCMHACILIGSDEFCDRAATRKIERFGVSPFDVVEIESGQQSIGIADVRTFIHRLQLTPSYSQKLVGVVRRAQLLTIEAQNALLKLLEEPPPRVQLILTTDNPDALLPTIISRCEIERSRNPQGKVPDRKDALQTVNKLFTSRSADRLMIADPYTSTRDSALQWLDRTIINLRYALVIEDKKNKADRGFRNKAQLSQSIHLCFHAKRQLSAYCHPKLVIDSLVLSFSSHAPSPNA